LGRFGGGVALAYYPGSAYSVDNYYIKLLTETGLIGLMAFLYLILSALRNGRRSVDDASDETMHILSIGIFVGLVAIVAHNMVENLFEFPLIPTYFWFFMGMLIALPHLSPQEELGEIGFEGGTPNWHKTKAITNTSPQGSDDFSRHIPTSITGLKVLHVIGGGEIGGAEELVLTQMNLLRRDGGVPSLVCLCSGPFAALARELGLPATVIPMRHKLDVSKVSPLLDHIRENEIQIVHTHGVRANLVARLAAKKAGIPIVTTVHSVLRYDYNSWWEAKLAWYLTRLTNSYTQKFIAISSAIAAEIAGMGVPSNRIAVIYSGLDMDKFERKSAMTPAKKRLPIKPGRRIICMIARLHPVKGHEYFLQAAQTVAAQRDDVDFLLVGEGEERAKITGLIKKLGLTDRVKMTGYYEQVEEIYNISHILCVPSLMEGLGLVVLEAMYFGVPVIASAIGGMTELIEDGSDGILVPPRDASALSRAMLRVLDDEPLRESLIGGGRQRVEQFTVESMIRQVELIYEQCVIHN
jgi:glycosyltransferase involved in cell wall biosynthesis